MLDLQESLAKIDAAAKRYVYISTGLGSWMNRDDRDVKFQKRHLWPERSSSRLALGLYPLYNILHDMKIYANVEIDDSESEHCYDDLDDAVKSWWRCKTYSR